MSAPVENFSGLSSVEAARRLKTYGPNAVTERRRLRPLKLFLLKFKSPLLLILIAASGVSFFLGQTVNALILMSMVLLSVILDFVNSYKSQKTLDQLMAKVITTATVVRDGEPVELPFDQIVPGDTVLLQAGDVVPADGWILESQDLFANQAVLTGESFPAEKHAARRDNPTAEPLPRDQDYVFLGTSIVTGYATIQVVRTGRGTEFGKIAHQLERTEQDTDFERNMRRFSLFVMRVILVMVAFVFIINALAGRDWLTSFLFALAIAIGVTPELLPVIMSVSLSRGSRRMADKGVIVKNLSAIQNFGSMNVLCTDKTGTLTQDHIALVKYVNARGESSESVLLNAYLNSYFHTGVANPLDNAVKEYRHLDISGYTKVDELPFDYQRRRVSIIVQKDGTRFLITKGAPEEIFKICHRIRDNGHETELDLRAKELITDQFQRLSEDGFRVLAVAQKNLDGQTPTHDIQQESAMTFLGFTAFLDPPKDTALQAIQNLENLGIEVKILTGDNEILTKKICRDIRLPLKGLLTGDEISRLGDLELRRLALETTVFARVTPEQKERIIRCLKTAGQVVGYLGDGINDAPAIQTADIGISVNNAVDVAKETADIILLRKSLDVLKDGVAEGRRTFRNTQKYILMGLSSNFGNMFSMMGVSAFLPFLPMLPTQVLLNNFIYDTSQLTLSSDTVDEDDVRRPVAWNLRFIRAFMLTFGPISSLFDFLTYGVLYWVFRASETQFQTGWFIESIATQVFVIYVIRTKKLPFFKSRPSLALFLNTSLAVAIAWILPYTPLGALFHFTPLPWFMLATIAGMVLVYLGLVEIGKRLFYRYYHLASPTT